MFSWELAREFGAAANIPHDRLYEYINRPKNRDGILLLQADYRNFLKAEKDAKEESEEKLCKQNVENAIEAFKKQEVVAEVRRRCKTDLEWLTCWFTWETNSEGIGKDISENRVTRESHGPILDLFVKKDDTKRIAEQDTRKLRTLLWPRGGMKSTIDVVDSVQWILNFPAIRILYLTGDDDLAVGFVDETKGHFIVKLDDPSLMNLYFPEFCVEESKLGSQFEFTCPLWAAKQTQRKEPTVQAAGITSSLSGRHYEVIKADDAVTNRNAENEDQCKKIAHKISVSARPGKMLRPFGYFDAVGTRYHEDDYYGTVLEKNVGDLKITTGKCWTLTENPASGQLILIGRGIVIKPEVVERLEKEGKPVNYKEAGKEGCDLLLPDIMPYSFLIGEWMDNEDTFEGQINQNPRSQTNTTFPLSLLQRSTVRYDEMPFNGIVSQTWDFAGPFSQQKGRDYCAASSAIWNDKGQFFVHDLIRNRFSPTDLAKAVVDFAMKWKPFVIGIEDATGSKFLEPTIIAEAQKTGNAHVMAVCGRIDWIKQDNQKDAKRMRMAGLHPWLTQGRMKFASYLPFLPILYDEFGRCMASGKNHNDIPDVISYQPRYAPRVFQMAQKSETQIMSNDQRDYNILYGPWLTESGLPADQFGRLGMGPPPVIIPEKAEPDYKADVPSSGMDPILGTLFG